MKPEIYLLVHNIRSIHNVGSIFRSAEGFGVKRILLSGYTPYPRLPNDLRLPHIIEKLTKDISKTALGAEKLVNFSYYASLTDAFDELINEHVPIVALEQSPDSVQLADYKPPGKIGLLLGEEVHGITLDVLQRCNTIIEIPMFGQKESFNVSVAAGIALYHLRTST